MSSQIGPDERTELGGGRGSGSHLFSFDAMMGTVIAFFIAALYLHPAAACASYVIKLKNGKEFVTSRYWEEGKRIMFYTSGGTLGFEKDFISKIEESDRPVETEMFVPAAPETVTEGTAVPQGAEGVEKQGEGAGAEKGEENGKIDVERYREKQTRLQGKLDDAYQKYLEATRIQDPVAKEKARKEMTGYSRQLYQLADELKKKNEGVLPPDWWKKKGP